MFEAFATIILWTSSFMRSARLHLGTGVMPRRPSCYPVARDTAARTPSQRPRQSSQMRCPSHVVVGLSAPQLERAGDTAVITLGVIAQGKGSRGDGKCRLATARPLRPAENTVIALMPPSRGSTGICASSVPRIVPMGCRHHRQFSLAWPPMYAG